MTTIGVIGLGNIGIPIAKNLLAAGYDVLGFDLVRNKVFESAGGQFLDSVEELGQQSQYVIMSLPTPEAVSSCSEELTKSGRAGQVVIDISSNELSAKQQNADRFMQSGLTMLDCEVSGLPFMVENRTAVIFQAGDDEVVREAKPVFDAITEKHFYLGEFGMASKTKMLANMMVAVHNLLAAEVLNLAANAGLHLEAIRVALSASAASSVTFSTKAPIMIDRDFENGQGPLQHMYRHIDRVSTLARDVGADTPLLDQASRIYQRAENELSGSEDIAALIKLLEK